MPTDNIRHKSLRLRICPNKSQEILINKTFGCCRLIYNLHLDERLKFYENNNLKNIKDKNERIKILKTFKPKTEKEWKVEYPFMKEVAAQSLQQARINCDNAFNNFFSKRTKFPKFKSKKNNYQSYKAVQCELRQLNIESHKIRILKLGWVNYKHKVLPKWFNQVQALKSITVEKSPSEKYFAVCLFEIENKIYKIENREDSIGLDYDCDDCYIDSNGKSALKDFGFAKQKQKNHKVLRKYQRQLARKTKGSNNYRKARIKLACIEEYIANCRRDWIEKETLRLVQNCERIGIESLSIKEMIEKSKNAKNYVDISWSTFVSRLEQKAVEYDCKIIKADKFYASSQICHVCGFKFKDVKTKHLENWICPCCGSKHQRDINAAINLKNYVPLERGKLMPVEDMKSESNVVLDASEYPVKQEAASL